MSGLDNLNKRLNYRGNNQQNRMISGKLASLKRALLYSYQAATAILEDGREFRCLINPDKLKTNYDDKIISIPFEDICLNSDKIEKTSEGIQPIGIKTGDVFTWKENNTKWLVYLQRLEEKAYFRAEIRRCDHSIELNGKNYWFFIRRRGQEDSLWHTSKGVSWNDLNYSLEMYITKDEFTQGYFKRFQIFEFDGNPWEVQDIDIYSTDGFIVVLMKEYYKNTIAEQIQEEKNNLKNLEEDNNKEEGQPYIKGPSTVYPYDEIIYKIMNIRDGFWSINNDKAIIKKLISDNEVLVAITTGRSGSFKLMYTGNQQEQIELNITIDSL